MSPDLTDRTRLPSECGKKLDDEGYLYKKNGWSHFKSLHPSECVKQPKRKEVIEDLQKSRKDTSDQLLEKRHEKAGSVDN